MFYEDFNRARIIINVAKKCINSRRTAVLCSRTGIVIQEICDPCHRLILRA
jgi:hypothetical protein